MSTVCETVGPILLLIRLADSNGATLSKLKGTVDYLKTKFVDHGTDSLEDRIAEAFLHRAPELESDIASAAYVLDQQFVHKSKHASSEVMQHFWKVTRNVLRVRNDAEWKLLRGELGDELAKFRMKGGGFAAENYQTSNTCSFWSVAGCHAPKLAKVALRLASLPCSSGEAERNWKEFKLNLTKTRNRLSRDKLEKMIFVRRFLKLKRAICMDETDTGFNDWVSQLLHDVTGDGDRRDASLSEDDESQKRFMDVIEAGEQEKINGKTSSGRTVVGLTALKKDNVAKSWLFNKYYNMCFVDKNPEGDELSAPLADKSKWEHRIIKDVVWWRSMGYSVESHLKEGGVANQSVEKYRINRALMRMIRESPYNVRPLYTREGESDDDEGDGDDWCGGGDDGDGDDGDSDDGDGDDRGDSSHDSDDDLPLSSVLADIRKNRE